MPPADKDGKKPQDSDLLFSDLDLGDLGGEFDWDKAINDWDPKFHAEGAAPPDLSPEGTPGIIVVESAPTAAPAARPAVVAATAASPVVVSSSDEKKSASTPSAIEALPPPPVGDALGLPPIALALGSDLPLDLEAPVAAPTPSKKPAQVEVSDAALDAQKARLLQAMLTTPETASVSASPAPAAISAAVSDDDDDDYDVQIETGAGQQSAATIAPEVAAAPASTLQAVSPPSSSSDPLGDLQLGVELSPKATEPSTSAIAASVPTEAQGSPAQSGPISLPPPPLVELASATPAPTPASVIAMEASASASRESTQAVASPAISASPAASTPAEIVQPTAPAQVVEAPRLATRPALTNSGPPLVPKRLPLPSVRELPAALPAASVTMLGVEAATRRHFLALLDTEASHRSRASAAVAAQLLVAAAQQAESLHEPADALDRYRSALETAAQNRSALRGMRRVLSWPGPTTAPDEATMLVDRESEHASAGERRGLQLWRAELHRVQGQLSEAKTTYQTILTGPRGKATKSTAQAGAVTALLGQYGIALAQQEPADATRALDELLLLVAEPSPLQTALQVERARQDELAGRDSAAATRYEAVLQNNPAGSLSAALGLLRTTVRLPSKSTEQTPAQKAHRQLLGMPLPYGLRVAISRQVARAQAAGTSARHEALRAAAEAGDLLSTEDLAQLQEQAGNFAEAGASHLRIAEASRDAAQRTLALTAAGEMLHRAGQLEKAQTVLQQALQTAAGTDLATDELATRLLARTSRTLGRASDLLAVWRQAGRAGTDGAYYRLLAARLLLSQAGTAQETGQPAPTEADARAAAIGELYAALQLRETYGPAIALLTDLLIGENKHAQAAQVLLRAARLLDAEPATAEGLQRRLYREEAARLLERAGQPAEAARVLLEDILGKDEEETKTDFAPSLQPALRWRLAALCAQLVGKVDVPLAQQLAEALRLHAEQLQSIDPQLAAQQYFLRGAVLAPALPQVATDGGPVEESWQRALQAEPMFGPALWRLYLRLQSASPESLPKSPLAKALVSATRARMTEAQQRPQMMLWALRTAALQEHEAGDPAGALQTISQLRSLVPQHPALLGLDETLFTTAWRAGHALQLIERELASDPDFDSRFALLLQAGEQLEAQKQPAEAAKRFAAALELRPAHPVARAGLVRSYLTAGNLDALDQLTRIELKEATDVQTRVAAYERQALIATLRGGNPVERSEAIMNAYRSILNVDANNHSAMRALERHYIAHENWGDLTHLYEQMGLVASDTAFSVHIHLDRARLRQKLAWQDKVDPQSVVNQIENDYRLALFRDRHCRPALRTLLDAALRRGELGHVAELSVAMAQLSNTQLELLGEPSEAQSAAVFYVRAAEAMAQLGRSDEEVVATYRSALKKYPGHLPALRGLLHYAVVCKDFAAVADSAAGLAEHLHDSDERYLHYMLLGVVSHEMLKDLQRAQQAFTAGLRLLPQREEAFERLRASFMGTKQGREQAQALAQLIETRLSQPGFTPANEQALRQELVQLYTGPLNDRGRAKIELEKSLAKNPSSAQALYMLGKLHADDAEYEQAVLRLSQYGQVEQRPAQLVALHLLLGELYAEKLKDVGKAMQQYSSVLQLQPQNALALSRLVELFMQQNKPQGALPLLKRLVKYTDDKAKKIDFLHRVAQLSESMGDSRSALEALRQAVELDPRNLPAIAELARYYEQKSDLQSLRIHLDRSAARFRPQLRERPRDLATFQSLLQIFLHRRTADLSTMAAGAITTLGQTVSAELTAQLEKQTPRKEPVAKGLRDAALDEAMYPQRVNPGFRSLFKLLEEPLGKLYGSDSKKLALMGVDRREKLPRAGHPIRELANKLATELGVGEFELYVTAAQDKNEDGKPVPYYTIEPLELPSLILSASLLEGSETERRFFLGGLLKLLQSKLVLPLRLAPDDLGVLVGGLVRQFVPDYCPLGFAEKRIINEAARQKRAIPSRLAPQVLPHAMECASATLDFESISETLVQCSHYAGLLLTGSVPSAVAALRRKGPAAERQIDDLLRYAVTEEFAELQRIAAAAEHT